MKRKLRGMKRQDIQLDFDLYRVNVPIPGVAGEYLSVVDLAPEGAEQTMIFIHGFAGCLETWEFQINYFARKYRVIAPDLRGHGQSDAPYTEYTMNELIADLDSIVTHLDLPPKFILVGHSFGGAVCIEFANAYPKRLSKLILIATAGEFPLPKAAHLATRIPAAFFRLWWDYRPRWNGEVHTLKRLMSNNLMKWQGWSMIRNISTPSLIVTGERDSYFPRWVFDDVSKLLPNAEIYDVGSAKHKVQLERHQAVNRGIERFINEQELQSWRTTSADGLLQERPWLRHYSKETPYTIPIPKRPLHTFLDSAAYWVPKRTALIFADQSLTYQQLSRKVNQCAHLLRGLGVSHGDRVMLALPNMPEFIIAYYATIRLGAVVVLPNPDANPEQIAEQAAATQIKILFTLTAFSQLAALVKSKTAVEQILFVNLRQKLPPELFHHFLKQWGIDPTQIEATRTIAKQIGRRLDLLLDDAPVTPPDTQIAPLDLAVIIFTSGTTEAPKGVCLTQENLVANTLQTRHWIPDLQYGEESCLTTIPLVHSYGMTNGMNIPIALGSTIVLLPYFDVTLILEQIKKYKITVFPGVPSMYGLINQAPNVRSYGLASIKACISGAAPLPIEIQEAFEKLTRGRLVEGYGLTEASPVTHANPLFGLRKPGSIGIPLPNTEARIISLDTHQPVPTGEIGELAVRGPQIMRGYWQASGDPNDESLIENGWLLTGDLARVDADGYFQIISRKKDLIIIDGHHVYPRDIEELLYENNKVIETAVVGHLSETGSEIHAFVVSRPNSNLTSNELVQLCTRRLPVYAIPTQFHFCDQLPKSFIGKILRRELIDSI